MIKLKTILSAGVLLASPMLIGQAEAKPGFPSLAPAAYYTGGSKITGINMVSCSTCHVGTATENNVTTSFGVAFDQRSDDDILVSLTTAYNTLAPLDSDGDGFSNQQEAFSGSLLNEQAVTPVLTAADMDVGNVAAKAILGGKVAALSLQSGVPATALGGIVSFSTPYNAVTTLGTSTDFLLKAGGAQLGATLAFYDNSGAIIASVPVNTAEGGYIADHYSGAVNVSVQDEGAFDLYTTAVFQAEAMAAYHASAIAIYANISPYANIIPTTASIDAYAKISPLATIEPYATVDAYAVIDAYAVVGAYAQVGSYAYVAAHVDVYTGVDANTKVVVDAYAQVKTNITAPANIVVPNGVGYVSARFALTTTPPTKLLLGRNAAAGDGTASGGLHCMTAGLGMQALMLFGLLGLGLLFRRQGSSLRM